MKLLGVVLLASFLSACSKHPNTNGFINALLDPHCLTQPVLMEHCDPKADPIRCQKVRLIYTRGCEQLRVMRVQQNSTNQGTADR
jgi:hypothetical protein